MGLKTVISRNTNPAGVYRAGSSLWRSSLGSAYGRMTLYAEMLSANPSLLKQPIRDDFLLDTYLREAKI